MVREISEGGKALARFIDYASRKPSVRFVTYSDLIRWMQVGGPAWWVVGLAWVGLAWVGGGAGMGGVATLASSAGCRWMGPNVG